MNFFLGPGLDGLFTDENDHYSFGKQRTHENGQDIPDVKYPDRINLMIPGIFP